MTDAREALHSALHSALPRARGHAARGELAAAHAILDALDPSVRASSLWHQAKGFLALEAGDADAAIASFEQACRIDPDVAEHRGMLGAALLEKARRAGQDVRAPLLERGLRELERAWTLRPITPDPGTTYAFALELSGQAERSLAILDEVLARHPGHVPALFNKASALKALGRVGEARDVLDEVLRIAPGFPPAVDARARL